MSGVGSEDRKIAYTDNFETFDYEDEERNRVFSGKGRVVQDGVFLKKDDRYYNVQ